MTKIILVIGTSGSGKSTWTKTLPKEYLIISADNIRIELTGDINNKEKDKEIYELIKTRSIEALMKSLTVVIDTTNLQKERRRDYINYIHNYNKDIRIEYKLMELNPELSKQRIKNDINNNKPRANVSNSTVDRHTELYIQMLEDIKDEPIFPYEPNRSPN